jgi:hypothetical protein
MAIRSIRVGMASLFLAACSLPEDGLGPQLVEDARGPAEPSEAGSMGAAADTSADAMTDGEKVSIDTGTAANAGDAGSGSIEGGGCVLPSGASVCCGSLACVDNKHSCVGAGICVLCQAACTDPTKPICCPTSSTKVTCQANPDEC